MNTGHLPSCIELVKGLSQCEPDVRGMNLRTLMASFKFQDEILKNSFDTILYWLDERSSGLTEEEDLRLRATVMMVREDKLWFKKYHPGELEDQNYENHFMSLLTKEKNIHRKRKALMAL